MSLEGRLRDLALAEVLQLLSASRKSGTLHLDAPLQACAARVQFQQGSVVDARTWRLADGPPPVRERTADEAREVEETVLDLLLWRDGAFRFAPSEAPAGAGSAIRMAIEPLLMEAVQRADVWARIADRVPHSRVVPAFIDIEPQQLPLLRLSPPQWEILTRVDGLRDLRMLAQLLGRDLLELAEQVHGLIGAGLLTIREGPVAPRHNPTPPAMVAVPADAHPEPSAVPGPYRGAPPEGDEEHDADSTGDLWIPTPSQMRMVSPARAEMAFVADEDSLFDPVQLGVTSADGLPRRRTPVRASSAVASRVAEPSSMRGQSASQAPRQDMNSPIRRGDEAARRGDFGEALQYWQAALQSPESIVHAERLREMIALTERLHALLHP